MRLPVNNKTWALLGLTERRKLIYLVVLMLIGMVLEMLSIGIVVPAIALLVQNDISETYPVLSPVLNFFGNPNQKTLIIAGMLILVGIYLVKSVFLAYLVWRQTAFGFTIQLLLSQKLFNIYLKQPYTFHLQRNTAQLIQNTINEVSIYSLRIIIPLIILITESMVLLGIGLLLLYFEPVGATVVILVLGSAAWGFHRSTRTRIARWGKDRLLHDGLKLKHLQQGLSGVKEVKLLGREEDFLAKFKQHNTFSAKVGMFHTTLQQLPRLWLELLAVLGLTTIVLSMLFQGRDMSSIMPILGLFAAAVFRLMPTVTRMLGSVQSLRYGAPVVETLYNEFKLDSPELYSQASDEIFLFQDELRIESVSFVYPGAKKKSLIDISVSIKSGETIGFIGPSGSGKSTLVDVILGLLYPDKGQIIADNKNINKNLRAWQNQIGYVPQMIYLTDDSLRRNIAFGLSDEEIDNTAVWRAIKAAQLDSYVDELPDGIETIVGERGVKLSGGQRQRIGIARALYHDPSILVLDEATSALDESTEFRVMQTINELHGKKTILLIAHRLTTVKNCDRLYRIENGRVVGEGSPESMLTSNNEVSLDSLK